MLGSWRHQGLSWTVCPPFSPPHTHTTSTQVWWILDEDTGRGKLYGGRVSAYNPQTGALWGLLCLTDRPCWCHSACCLLPCCLLRLQTHGQLCCALHTRCPLLRRAHGGVRGRPPGAQDSGGDSGVGGGQRRARNHHRAWRCMARGRPGRPTRGGSGCSGPRGSVASGGGGRGDGSRCW